MTALGQNGLSVLKRCPRVTRISEFDILSMEGIDSLICVSGFRLKRHRAQTQLLESGSFEIFHFGEDLSASDHNPFKMLTNWLVLDKSGPFLKPNLHYCISIACRPAGDVRICVKPRLSFDNEHRHVSILLSKLRHRPSAATILIQNQKRINFDVLLGSTTTLSYFK